MGDQDNYIKQLIRQLNELQQELDSLKISYLNDSIERKQIEFNLRERLKELNCHDRISELMSNSNLSLNDVIEQIVQIIPPSWQFPEIASASVQIYDKIFKSVNFEKTDKCLAQVIKVNQKIVGRIEVCYPVDQLPDIDQLFLPEETKLLFSIAVKLGNFIEKEEKKIALSESEEKYRNLIESISDVIYEIDDKGLIKYISPSVEKILGYKPNEVIGKPFHYFVGENEEFVAKRFTELRERTNIQNEYRILSKSGKTHWIRLSTNAIFNNGNFKGGSGTLIDITENKLIELELQKSESLYRSILHASPDVITITDLDGRILFASPKALEMFRYDPTYDFTKHLILEFIDPSQHEKTQHAIALMFQGVFPGAEEYLGIRSDGTNFNIEVNGEFIRDNEGHPTSIVFVTRDISDRKLAEAELLKLSLAVEQSPVSIVITNLEGNIEYVNPKACETTGYKPDELIGKNPRVLKSGETQSFEYDFLWNNISTGKDWHGIFHNKRKNGELYWESSVITPIQTKNGKITHYLAIKEDITEQRKTDIALAKSEERFSQMASQSKTVIWEVDDKGLYTYISPIVQEVWGYLPEELIGIKYFYDLYPSEDRVRVKNAVLKSFADKRILYNLENQIVTSDNKIIWVSTSGIPILDDQKNLIGYRGADNEITERKLAQEALRQSEAALNQAQEISLMSSWELNLITGELTWSRNYYQMMGIPMGTEMKSEYFLERVHPGDIHLVEEKFEELRLTRKPVTYDLRLRMIDDEYKWIENNVVPIFDGDEFIAIKGVNINVTEKKKAEEKIRYQNERLQAIIQAIPDLIFIIDKEGEYLEFFASETEKLLISPDNIIGSNISQAFDKEMTRLFMSKIHEVISRKKVEIINYTISLPDSPSTHFEARIAPLDETKVLILSRDITLQATKDTEIKKLSLAVEQSPVSIVITDLNGNIEYVNPSFEETTGYRFDEVLGQNTKILKSGKTADEVYNYMWESIKSGNEWHGEWINKKKNGEFYWENISISPIHDNTGKITNYLAVKQDITERKQIEQEILDINTTLEIKIKERTAQLEETNSSLLNEIEVRKLTEQALAQSEKSYRTVVENVNEVIFQTDANGLWKFLNKSWEAITGFSVNESLGQLFVNYVHPDDRASNWELFEPLIKREKEYCRHEIRYLTKNGGFRWIEVFARLGLNDLDQIIGTYGTLRDITERKMAEDALLTKTTELENFFSVTLDLLLIADVSGNFIKVNKAWEQILGYSPEDLENWNFLELIHPDDIQSTIEAMNVLRKQQPVLNFINRYKTKDGNYRFIEWNSSSTGNLIYAAARDITESKRAEEFEYELLQLSPKLTGIPLSEINSAIKLALARIGQFLTADRAYIFEFDSGEANMSNSFEWCNDGISPEIENLQNIPCDMLPRWMEVLHKHENIVIPSVKDLPETWKAEREILEPQGIKSVIIIPMLVENNLIGFVGLDSVKEKKEYNSAETNILKVWSSMLASLINNQRTERLLEQTRQNYETFFNTIDDFLWVLDEQGNIIHANNTVKTRLEYSFDELYTKSVLMVHPPERRAEAGRIVGEMLAGTTEFCPVPVVTKSGKQIPVETRVKSGFWDGVPVLFGVSKDVSKIQLSEQKFSSAFQSNSAMMSIAIIESRKFIDVNNSMVETMGYSREEIIGRSSEELGFYVDSFVRDQIFESLNHDIRIQKQEVVLRTKIGRLITGLLSAEPIFVGGDRCLLTVVIDITERKKAEDEIRKARYEAEKANMAKSEFLSRMSHELRTPMNSILGFAQLLEMGELNPGQKKGVNHIMKSGRHLLDLINEVLDISRIEAGRLSLSLEPVKVDTIIQEMIDFVKPHARNRQLKFEFINIFGNQLFVKSDRQRLKQILLNLLNNAVKYNKEGGSVIVKTEIMPQNRDMIVPVRISISDTGLGISPNDLPKLFNPFERIGAEKSRTEGTGLGLAVVKKLVEIMGGNLGVESTPGEGSTFWIELPQCESQLKSVEKLGESDELASGFINKSGTILYIEDNVSNIELVEQILSHQRESIRLIASNYGGQAVNLAITNHPDLILLDLDLPDLHGSEVLKLLLAEESIKEIPVVIISADAMPQQIERLRKAGAKNYLTKPLDVLELLKVIDQYIKG